jgi:glycosyltransferase involved in cell wall biosynthesis
VNVLLIGNYESDRQESMQRFGQLLLAELRRRGANVQLLRPPARLGRVRTRIRFIDKWASYFDKFVLFPKTLRQLGTTNGRRAQSRPVIHICDHSNAIYTRWIRSALVTCHDLLAVRSALGEFPENPIGLTGRRLQRMILNGLARARHVACVSETTRCDLLRLARVSREATSVVPNGLNYAYRPLPRGIAEEIVLPLFLRHAASGQSLSNNTPRLPHYLLHVGGNQWYKNRPGMLRVYQRLTQVMPNAPPLVLAGKSLPKDMRRWIARHGISHRVWVLAGVDNDQLCALYSCAALLFFPSLAEGFGWPIIEAQASGCLVVTTNRSPMTEIAGSSAFYCDPGDVSQSAGLLKQILTASHDEHAARRFKGLLNTQRFTPDKMVDRYMSLYRDVLAN